MFILSTNFSPKFTFYVSDRGIYLKFMCDQPPLFFPLSYPSVNISIALIQCNLILDARYFISNCLEYKISYLSPQLPFLSACGTAHRSPWCCPLFLCLWSCYKLCLECPLSLTLLLLFILQALLGASNSSHHFLIGLGTFIRKINVGNRSYSRYFKQTRI